MKRLFTSWTAALMLLSFLALPLGMRGQDRTTVTDTLTRASTGVTGTSYAPWSDVTSNSDAVYAGQSAGGNGSIQLRTTNNNSGIITTSSGGTVTSVSVTWNSNTASGRTLNIYGSNSAYSDPTELYNSSTQGTLLGTIECGTSTSLSIDGSYAYIGMRSASNAMYLEKIEITWSTGGTPTCATPTFSPVAGPYSETQNVTISTTTDGATIYYTNDGSAPTFDATGYHGTPYTGPITVSETTTLKAIAVKEGMNNSNVATATYSFPYTTIPALFAAATSSNKNVLVTFDNWVVSGVATTGKNIFVTDNDGHGLIIYYNNNMSSTFAAGDILTGTAVACQLKLFNGSAELLNVNASDLTITEGGTVTTADIDMADLTGVNTGALVHYDNLTCSVSSGKYYLSDSTTTIQVYHSLYANAYTNLEANKVYNITAVYQQFNSTKEVLPRSADDIEEATVTPTEQVATPTFTPAEGTYTEAQTVTISCETAGATIYYTLDGTDPIMPTGETGTEYTDAITISETTTVKAVAVRDGMTNSEIATAVYTINITPPAQETKYALITNVNALIEGDKYIIVGVKNETFKALGKQKSNNRAAVAVTLSHDTISSVPATSSEEDAVFELTLGQENGHWTFYDEITGGYLYAASSSSNNLKTQSVNDDNGEWTIEIASSGVATITAQGSNTRNCLKYNESSSVFSCYASTSTNMLEVYLYKAGDIPTPPAPTYYTISVADGIANGTVSVDTTQALEGTTIHVTAIANDNYELDSLSYYYTGAAPIDIMAEQQFTMPAADVTVYGHFSATAPTPVPQLTEYVLITDESALVAGDKYIIVGVNDSIYKALGKQTTNNRSAVAVTPSNDTITVTPANLPGLDAVYELTLGQDDGNWTFYSAADSGYLYAASSSSNWLRTQAQNDANGQWTIEIAADGMATITAQGTNTRNSLRYNNSSSLFACYASTSTMPQAYLYKAGDIPTPPTPPTPTQDVVATPTFSPEGGAYITAQTVSIACDTVGATIYYTTDGTDPTPNSLVYGEPFEVSATTTVKAYAVKEGLTDSAIDSVTYTIIEPMTIAEAKALQDDQYALVKGVVTFIDGRNVYVQDTTSGIVLYLNNNTMPQGLAIGDEVMGYGKKTAYKGLIELGSINGGNANQFVILSNDNALPMAVATIEEILADFQSGANLLQSTRVQIQDAIIGTINNSNNTPIAQGENTLNIYKLPLVEGLEEDDIVTVIGIVSCYNNPQLRVSSADDVTFEHPTGLTVDTDSLGGFTYAYGEGPSGVKTFTVTGRNFPGTTYINGCEYFEICSFPEGNFIAEPCITINTYNGNFSFPIQVRLKADLEIGSYEDQISICHEGIDTLYVTLTGTVTEHDQPSSDYVRISGIEQLTNGSKVIFAARYSENLTEYYAMPAQASGKPEGVSFTSVVGSNAETLPVAITDEEDAYYWTVETDGTTYTFTNAEGAVLGWNSSTNFATGGDNTAWTIESGTAEATAMVPNCTAFNIINVGTTSTNTTRGIALNNAHKFGPYAVSNMTSVDYNFFIDLFVSASGGTPTCAAPTFSPEGGVYFEAQTVTISCTTADAVIYYTLDGSDPTAESMVYEEPIEVAESMTIKAIAMKEDYNDSAIAEAEYTIILGSVTIFNQDWEGDMNGWTFVNVEGNKPWTIGSYSNNHYADANGYNDDVANEQWCISPAFNIDNYENVSLSFRNAVKYDGPDMQVYFSNDYDGENPTEATWTELEYVKSEGNFAWAESGMISLEDLEGEVCYIGFRYLSNLEDGAAHWEVDDITLIGFTSAATLTVAPTSLTGFSYIEGNGPSAEQSFLITGINMTGNVIVSIEGDAFEMSDETGEDFDAMEEYEITPDEGAFEETIYVRMAEGLEAGSYMGTITVATDDEEITVTLEGTVTEPVGGGDWNRIGALSDLNDGDMVIIAARYDAEVTNGYYAMKSTIANKIDGVLFTSVTEDGVEKLPSDIADDANSYLWSVTIEDGVITLTNVEGASLGYGSGTNFASGNNTEWNIGFGTAGDNAMVPNHSGFLINNASSTNRYIAENASHNYGAYAESNINHADYNFYLDIFVQGGTATQVVATPTFSVASGTYYDEFDVEITCATEGATIYYTTDGSDPSAASTVYEGAIHVSSDMTLKAIAMMEGYEDSGIATANYEVILGLTVIFNQDWEGEMNGWTFVTVEGNKPWNVNSYGGNHFAGANGYGDDVANEQWCISPAFDLTGYTRATLTFRNAVKFDGPALELLFSTNYDGEDPTMATWTPMDFIMSEGNYVWTESGEIILDEYRSENCYIAFRYTSDPDDGAASWEVDDILLVATVDDAVSETTTLDVHFWNSGNEIFVENNTNGNLQMMVYDLLGQQVLAKTVNAGVVRCANNLANGLYVVTLQNSKGRMSVKMVVR